MIVFSLSSVIFLVLLLPLSKNNLMTLSPVSEGVRIAKRCFLKKAQNSLLKQKGGKNCLQLTLHHSDSYKVNFCANLKQCFVSTIFSVSLNFVTIKLLLLFKYYIKKNYYFNQV